MKRKSPNSLFSLLLLAVLISGVLVGCSSKDKDKKEEKSTEPASLQLNFFPDPEFVGYYVALEKGFYAEEGVQLELKPFTADMGLMTDVLVNNTADFTILGTGDISSIVSSDIKPVAVMAVFQVSPLVMFSHKESGIVKPQDMVGKKVGVKSEGWASLIHAVLKNAGVDPADIIEVQVGIDPASIEQFYNGEVDVWTGFATSEPVLAQVNGHEVNIIYTIDYGVGTYEGVVAVRQELIDKKPAVVQGFVSASMRGWQYALAHPDEAAQIMLKYQPDQTLDFHKAAILAIQPLVQTGLHPIGWIDGERWKTELGDKYNPEWAGFSMQFVEAAK